MKMLRITFVMLFALLSFIVNNEAQHEARTLYQFTISGNKPAIDQKAYRNKPFYPLTFGSGLMVLDHTLVCYEEITN